VGRRGTVEGVPDRAPPHRPLRALTLLREAGALLLRLTGIPLLARRLVAPGRVGILLYHDPDPEVFERHLEHLSARYEVIPFGTLVDALENGEWPELPRPGLVIHLDDGYRRNHRLLEGLERHGVTPTLYVCSHIVGTRRHFWSKLSDGRSKRLRLLGNRELREKLEEEADFRPEREYAERQALSVDELSEISGRVDVQSHGRYHFSLLTLDDATLREELAESRSAVERLTGEPCEHFSFPFGDHGDREIEAVRRCGYRTARTTLPGWNDGTTDPYRLRIVADVPDRCSVNRLRAQLTGLPRLFKWLGYRLFTRHFHALRQRVLARRRVFGRSGHSDGG